MGGIFLLRLGGGSGLVDGLRGWGGGYEWFCGTEYTELFFDLMIMMVFFLHKIRFLMSSFF